MWLKGFNTREVADVGASLADQFITAASQSGKRKPTRFSQHGRELQTFLAQVDREARPLRLGLFRRAKLWFDAIPSTVLDSALDLGLLVGRLGLTDRNGNPLCAAVRPPVIEWSAEAAE